MAAACNGAGSRSGFVLLSASLTWVLSIYPILEYRLSVAHYHCLLPLIHMAISIIFNT